MTREQFAEIRAGIFMMVTLVGFGAMMFILGTQKGYFAPQVTLKTRFLNVYGLKAGAPVRFMGVGIGQEATGVQTASFMQQIKSR